MKILFQIAGLLIVLGLGWVLGDRYGLPEAWRAQIGALEAEGIAKGKTIARDLAEDAGSEAGRLLSRFEEAETHDLIIEAAAEAVRPAPPPDPVPATPAPPNEQATDSAAISVKLCTINVSNAPPSNADGYVIAPGETASVNGVGLLVAPATGTCLSSGFGPRGSAGRVHKGIDFYAKSGGDVMAAAGGTVLEALYRDDYGYMVVIDHGSGVYTRYAHLQRFGEGVVPGMQVAQGAVLGPVGNSGAYSNIRHLHYEVLTGDYDTPKQSFGLTPVNPFSL